MRVTPFFLLFATTSRAHDMNSGLRQLVSNGTKTPGPMDSQSGVPSSTSRITFVPSSYPSRTINPSTRPTAAPSDSPTGTEQPTTASTKKPALVPTTITASVPTQKPSAISSASNSSVSEQISRDVPNTLESKEPTPTLTPTMKPTTAASLEPTPTPTLKPTTAASTSSKEPTPTPTFKPTTAIPVSLSKEPTTTQTMEPTKMSPNPAPSLNTTKLPTSAPTALSPTPVPTLNATHMPTVVPTSASPTLAPTLNVTKMPTVAPTTMIPTPFPTVTKTEMPTMVPTTVRPTLAPTLNVTKMPTLAPTTMIMITLLPTNKESGSPSRVATSVPSPAVSTSPTVVVSTTPSYVTGNPTYPPSPIPSGVESSFPSTIPTPQATMVATVTPTVTESLTPSLKESRNPSISPTDSPSASSLQMGASAQVSISSSEIMDNSTISIFENTTLDFLNAYIPLYNGTSRTHTVEMIEVEVVGQSVEAVRRNSRSLQSQKLVASVNFKANVLPGDPGEDFVLVDFILATIEKNHQAYDDALAEASSFFEHDGSRSASISAVEGQGGATGGDEKKAQSLILIIVGVCLATLALGGLTAYRFLPASRSIREPQEPPLDVMSWSTTSPTSMEEGKRYQSAFSAEDLSTLDSPKEVEVSNDWQPESQEEHDTPSVSSSTLSVSILGGRLSPIAEDKPAKLEECDYCDSFDGLNSVNTPCGTEFVQLDFNVVKLGSGHALSSTPHNAIKSRELLADLADMETEWEGQLDSKVTPASATPKHNNLQKYNKRVSTIADDMLCCNSEI